VLTCKHFLFLLYSFHITCQRLYANMYIIKQSGGIATCILWITQYRYIDTHIFFCYHNNEALACFACRKKKGFLYFFLFLFLSLHKHRLVRCLCLYDFYFFLYVRCGYRCGFRGICVGSVCVLRCFVLILVLYLLILARCLLPQNPNISCHVFQ